MYIDNIWSIKWQENVCAWPQDPRCRRSKHKRFKWMLIYFNTQIFRKIPWSSRKTTLKQQINGQKRWKMKEKDWPCFGWVFTACSVTTLSFSMLTVIFPSHPAFQRSVSNAQRLFNNMKEKYVPWAPTGEQEWTPDLTTGESAAHQPVLCLP